MAVSPFSLPILAFLLVLVLPVLAYAETKILTAEATYLMGDGETPSFAEAMVLQKAKQTALEQAGTYVESYTKVQHLDLTDEEIQTIAGGLLQVETLEKKRSIVGNGLQFFIKINATVTTDKMEELARRIKGKNVAEEYRKLREDYARLIQEVGSWKKLAETAPPGIEREAALRQIRQEEKIFSAVQTTEPVLFKKLASGQLAHMAEEEEAIVKEIGHAIAEDGHIIRTGKVTVKPVEGRKEQALLIVPIFFKVSDHLVRQIIEAGQALGVSIILTNEFGAEMHDDSDVTLAKHAMLDNGLITLIRLAEDLHTAQLFQEVIGALAFSLQLVSNERIFYCVLGSQYAATIAPKVGHNNREVGLKVGEAERPWHSLRRLFPIYEVESGMSNVETPADSRGYVAILQDEVDFKLGIIVPRDVGERLQSITAQIVQTTEAENIKGQRLSCEVFR